MSANCAQMLAVVTERIQWQTMPKLFTETAHIDALLPPSTLRPPFLFFSFLSSQILYHDSLGCTAVAAAAACLHVPG